MRKLTFNFKLMTHSLSTDLISILADHFVKIYSEDKLNDLIEFIHRQFELGGDDVTPEVILASELLAVISYHPNFVNKCRTPRFLTSLDSASELEDSIILRQVMTS